MRSVESYRFIAATAVALLGWLNIQLATNLANVREMSAKLLAGQPVPAKADLLFQHSAFFVLMSYALPVTAYAVLFFLRTSRANYVVGTLIVIIGLQYYVQHSGTTSALQQIVQTSK